MLTHQQTAMRLVFFVYVVRRRPSMRYTITSITNSLTQEALPWSKKQWGMGSFPPSQNTP